MTANQWGVGEKIEAKSFSKPNEGVDQAGGDWFTTTSLVSQESNDVKFPEGGDRATDTHCPLLKNNEAPEVPTNRAGVLEAITVYRVLQR